jgi:hypothetical protein
MPVWRNQHMSRRVGIEVKDDKGAGSAIKQNRSSSISGLTSRASSQKTQPLRGWELAT